MSLSIFKIAQGTSVQRRDRGPFHKHLRFCLEFNTSYRVSPSYELRQIASKEITQVQWSCCLPWRAQHRMHQAVTNGSTTLNVSLRSTRLAILCSTSYSLLNTICSKLSNMAREVFWLDILMPGKLDENIQSQWAPLHIADYKAHIVWEMKYAPHELFVPVVYPDGIELNSSVDEKLHDVRKNCFPRSL